MSAKLFFGLALVSAVIGAALFRRDLPLDMYLFPLAVLNIPRLIPFGLGIISIGFGLAYLLMERGSKRRFSVPLTLVQIAFLLTGVFGQIILTRFWWRVLGEEQATNLPLPVWSAMLIVLGFPTSFLAFLANIFVGSRSPFRKASITSPKEPIRS